MSDSNNAITSCFILNLMMLKFRLILAANRMELAFGSRNSSSRKVQCAAALPHGECLIPQYKIKTAHTKLSNLNLIGQISHFQIYGGFLLLEALHTTASG